ncbi:MAG: hypothetical protein UZ07_CHB004001456, partial [Chlorobi bacterium OLB7]
DPDFMEVAAPTFVGAQTPKAKDLLATPTEVGAATLVVLAPDKNHHTPKKNAPGDKQSSPAHPLYVCETMRPKGTR